MAILSKLYLWPPALRIFLSFLLALAVLMQTFVFVISVYRRLHGRSRILEILFESSVILLIFCCSLLHGELMESFEMGIVTAPGYAVLRTLTCLSACGVSAVLSVVRRRPLMLFYIPAALLIFPMAEALPGGTFSWLFCVAVLFWLLRAIYMSIYGLMKARKMVTEISIKNAIDTLRTGVLFYESDGNIILCNESMQKLMTGLTGRVRRNGRRFAARMMNGPYPENCTRTSFEGQTVCLLPDSTAWMFSENEIDMRGRRYIQLTASDMTEQWRMTEELQRSRASLQRKSEELKFTIENLQTLCREKELQRAKMRAHDILGQRLSILLSMIHKGTFTEDARFGRISHGLLDELQSVPDTPQPKEDFGDLRQIFASIGVEIQFDGALPADAERAGVFVEIIRESVANAVRHGFASHIFVHAGQNGEVHFLEISNNGHIPPQTIVEGGGIGGMRKKIEPHGGSLKIKPHPKFTLKVELPGGEEYDQSYDS